MSRRQDVPHSCYHGYTASEGDGLWRCICEFGAHVNTISSSGAGHSWPDTEGERKQTMVEHGL